MVDSLEMWKAAAAGAVHMAKANASLLAKRNQMQIRMEIRRRIIIVACQILAMCLVFSDCRSDDFEAYLSYYWVVLILKISTSNHAVGTLTWRKLSMYLYNYDHPTHTKIQWLTFGAHTEI